MSELEKTCGNCKYRGKDLIEDRGWLEDPTIPDDIRERYFTCDFIKHNDGTYGYIWNEKATKDYPVPYIREPVPKTKAFTCDGSDYHSALCVSSDFGCNQWEAKD